MRIIQITDLHIGKTGEETYGVDVRNNFLEILGAVKGLVPDYLVITGDLCFKDGEIEVYTWVKKHLQDTQIPFHIIGGNHDNISMIQQVFGTSPSIVAQERYYQCHLGKYKTLFLDTSSGVVSEQQSDWIKQQLDVAEKEILVFLHHPPLRSGVPFMDTKHSLQNKEALQRIFFDHPARFYAFCGHYHVDRIVSQKNLTTFITPSCFFQINPHFKDFKVDHYGVGYRIIDLVDDQLYTAVRYLR